MAFRLFAIPIRNQTLESMNTDEALAFWRATKFARWMKKHDKRPPASRISEAKRAWKSLAKKKQANSMLNMGRPSGHKTLPYFPSEREKVLFAAHAKRRESGWIRG